MPQASKYRDVTPPETQFIPQSDDEETLWNVECILEERKGEYLVRWEGADPATGKPWPPSWVAKYDCTDDLIGEWKKEKASRQKRVQENRTKTSKKRTRGISDEQSTSSRSSSTLPVKSGNESSHESPQPANKKSKGPSKLRMEVEIPASAKRIKPRESIKRKRSPSEPLKPESETEAREETDNHSSYEPPVELLDRQSSDEEHNEPSPIPIPPKKKTKRAMSEEVLPPPPTIPKEIKKRVVLKTPTPPPLRDSPPIFDDQLSPLGPFQTQQAEEVELDSPERDIDEDEESQQIAPKMSIKAKISTPVKLTAVERASHQKVVRGNGLDEGLEVQPDMEVGGSDKFGKVTAASNEASIGQTITSAPKRRPIKSSTLAQKKKSQTRFAVQYEDEVNAEVPGDSAKNVDQHTYQHTSKRSSGTPDFERASKDRASPDSTPPEDIPDINIHNQTIVPETQPSQPSISADTRLQDSPQAPANRALAPVPDISPSKFTPYLSQSTEQTSSPVEEFSPTKHPTQSALESISDEFTHTQRSRNAKSSSMPNTQQSKAVEPPTFDRISVEALDVLRASTSPEGTPQTLQRMEEEFVDYGGGHEEGFRLFPESQMAGGEAEIEIDDGQRIPTPEMTHSPVTADPSQLQIARNSPRLSATSSNKPASIPENVIHPRLQSVGNQPSTPTPLGRLNTVPFMQQSTPRTVRRTRILEKHTDSVPDNAFDQLDIALRLLNEKSEEIHRLKELLFAKEEGRLGRELEFQKLLREEEMRNQKDLANQQENENFFKQLYLQASREHEQSKATLGEVIAENAILKGQLRTSVAQVREHYTGQISQLRDDLHRANATANLFMEQASRTASVRRDAGEAPKLRERVAKLSKDLQEADERETALTMKVRLSEDSALVGNMRQELVRLMSNEQNLRSERRRLQRRLDTMEKELEEQKQLNASRNLTQSQEHGEHGEQEVLVCQWAADSTGEWCSKELESREQLEQHLIQNHLAPDPTQV